MIQGLNGVILTLLASVACPALAMTQVAQEDPVRRAVRQYQTKVDQLEQLTKRVLASRKQQLQAAEAQLRKQQDEAAAGQRKLATRNVQLSTLVAQLKDQLATANTERNRLQRSLKEREAENLVLQDRMVTAEERRKHVDQTVRAKQDQVAALEARVARGQKHQDRNTLDAASRARLHRLEDQVTKMDQWARQLRWDVQTLLGRSTERGGGETEEEEEESRPADIHIHNHGGSVILHFHGSGRPRVHRHDDADNKVGHRNGEHADSHDVAEANGEHSRMVRRIQNAIRRARRAEHGKQQ